MGTIQKAPIIPVSVPIRGLDKKSDLAAMAANVSPWLKNVTVEDQSVKVRPGYVIHCTPGATVLGLGTWGTKNGGVYKLFAFVNSATPAILDISTTTPSTAYTRPTSATSVIAANHCKGRTYFSSEVGPSTCGAYYNGSSWSAWGFTYGGVEIGSRVVCSYKGRIYIFNGTNIYFGGLTYLTGATSLRDISDFLDLGGNVVWAVDLKSPGDRPDEMYLVFGTDAGEILAYAGEYPDSASWNMVGHFKTSPPLGWNSVIEYGSDHLLMTRSGLISLRDLFSSGSVQAEESSWSSQIDSIWKSLAPLSGTSIWNRPISGVFWPEQSKIFILFPGRITDSDGSISTDLATMLVLNCNTKAWSLHDLADIDSNSIHSLTYYDDNLYFISGSHIMTIDKDRFADEVTAFPGNFEAYAYEIQGAYSTLGSSNEKTAKTFAPILKTDFARANVTMRAAADMGRKLSAATTAELQDGYNKPLYNVGVTGTYIQWRLLGDTDKTATDGLELFAMGVSAA